MHRIKAVFSQTTQPAKMLVPQAINMGIPAGANPQRERTKTIVS